MPHSRSFAVFVYFLAAHPALGMQLTSKRKQRSENYSRLKKRDLHELSYKEIVNSGTIRLAFYCTTVYTSVQCICTSVSNSGFRLHINTNVH